MMEKENKLKECLPLVDRLFLLGISIGMFVSAFTIQVFMPLNEAYPELSEGFPSFGYRIVIWVAGALALIVIGMAYFGKFDNKSGGLKVGN